jgi:SAM-dependent methyltransferase
MNESHLQFLASPEWAKMLEEDLLPWIVSVGDLGDDVLEVGPGPGLTTDLLRRRAATVTAVEVDDDLAAALGARLAGTNVQVLHGDAADAGLASDAFSAVTAFSMLHHMPSTAQQHRLFAEVHRVLQPGGRFLGVDSLDLDRIRDAHAGDTFNPIDPDVLVAALEDVGLRDVRIERQEYQFRFVAAKEPAA